MEHPAHIIIKSEIVDEKEVATEKLSPHKRYCHLTVTDDDIGFEPEYNEHIFGMFQRLHSKSAYDGTGMGLVILRKIIDNHNGIITATGQLNKGATFDIYIPVS